MEGYTYYVLANDLAKVPVRSMFLLRVDANGLCHEYFKVIGEWDSHHRPAAGLLDDDTWKVVLTTASLSEAIAFLAQAATDQDDPWYLDRWLNAI